MGLLTNLVKKSATAPDWGVLERYLAWAFGGGASATGIIVNPQTAMQAATVYSCNKVLAESIGMLPCCIYQRGADGGKTPAQDHPLWPLLHDAPNEYQTSVEFFEMMVTHLNLRGNSYAYINRSRSGRVVELLPLHPDVVRAEMAANFELRYHVTMPDGSFKPFAPGELLHVKGLTLNGWLGISPIAYARESIGLALATEKFGGQLFRNGAKMGGVLQHPGKLGEASYNRLKETFDQAYSGENAHKTAILEEGMSFNAITMSSEDSQFLETRKYQRSEIAAIFRVPPHMIGDLEKATFSNIEQQALEFVQWSLMPWLVRIEKAIKRDLLNRDERKAYQVRFNVASMYRGDAKTRSAYYGAGIKDGWLTRNEARVMEAETGAPLNPLAGLDLPLMPLNMTDGTQEPEDDDAGEAAGGTEPAANKALIIKARQPNGGNQQIHLHNHVTAPGGPMEVRAEFNAPRPADVNVQVAPASVHVAPGPAPVVQYKGGDTVIHMPEQPAPTVKAGDVTIVNQVPAVQDVNITSMPERTTEGRVERDPATGNIIGNSATERDA